MKAAVHSALNWVAIALAACVGLGIGMTYQRWLDEGEIELRATQLYDRIQESHEDRIQFASSGSPRASD